MIASVTIMSTKFTRLAFPTTGDVAIPFFVNPPKNRYLTLKSRPKVKK